MNAGTTTNPEISAPSESRNPPKPATGLLRFIEELRRRRVCRAATMYCVALWLVCQIVEMVYIELELPEWTLKFVMVVGLVGLPLVLILSWIFDLTPDGLVAKGSGAVDTVGSDAARQRRPIDRTIDCGLLMVALLIGIELALTTDGADTDAATLVPDTVAVLPFEVASPEAGFVAQSLCADLQNILSTEANVVVIVPRDPHDTIEGFSLGGTVTAAGEEMRVTATMIDNRTRELIWTKVFQQSEISDIDSTSRLAREIVASVPGLLPPQMSGRTDAR